MFVILHELHRIADHFYNVQNVMNLLKQFTQSFHKNYAPVHPEWQCIFLLHIKGEWINLVIAIQISSAYRTLHICLPKSM